MRNPPPDAYKDGCTYGPSRFGAVSHVSVCNGHDLDWWYGRTAWKKTVADFRWAGGVVGAHWKNFPFQPLAAIYAVVGLGWLMTGGWVYWAGWVGPWQEYRDQLKS